MDRIKQQQQHSKACVAECLLCLPGGANERFSLSQQGQKSNNKSRNLIVAHTS
jgi:hypothetical protein